MIGFPLLIIPFAIYNMIAFITPMDWATKLYVFPLKSGGEWSLTLGDAFLVFSLLMLMFEFIKSTRHGKSLVEHFLGLLLAGGAAAEFAMVRQAGNSVFLLFAVICFVDLFAGFAASLRRARRTVVVETVEPAAPVAPPPQPVRMEPVAKAEPWPEPKADLRAEPRVDPFVKVEPAEKIP